jgi:thiamine pyrophosphate-dependent acetolactate synthase large subunit-like protein
VKAIYESLPEGAIVVIDGGEIGSWSLQLLEHARASLSLLSTGYLGFLGNGWGSALGAAIADPSRQIILITGDGAAGFHLAELDTFARFKLKVLTIIGNNYAWGMSQAGQELIYGQQNPIRQASKLSPKAEYQDVASALSCESAKVEKIEEISSAIKKLLDTGKPGLLNMIIADSPTHSGTAAMVNPTDGPNWIVVPYYDNVPRPFYKN